LKIQKKFRKSRRNTENPEEIQKIQKKYRKSRRNTGNPEEIQKKYRKSRRNTENPEETQTILETESMGKVSRPLCREESQLGTCVCRVE